MKGTNVSKDNSNHYVKEADLRAAIADYKATKSERSRNVLARLFMSIAYNLTSKGNFYKFKNHYKNPKAIEDDMASDAYNLMMTKIDGFQLEFKTSAFSYFTQTAKNDFYRFMADKDNDKKLFETVDRIENL